MESRNWGSSFHFSRPPMTYPMRTSSRPFHRMNEEFRMSPYSRPLSYHDVDNDFDFDNNHDVRGNAFWGAPAPFESSQSWRPRQRRNTFTSSVIKPYVKPEERSKRGKGRISRGPYTPGASQAASSEVIQQKRSATPNGNARKYKAGETSDPDVPTQPIKKFKTNEPTVPAEKPDVNSSAMQSDAKGMYSCTLCTFETLDEKEIQRHFYSFLHREVLKHLCIFFPKQRVDFLHEYLLFKKKKMFMQQKNSNIQPLKEVFKGMGQGHYMRCVQAAHCDACDVLIPYVQEPVAEHVQSDAHKENHKLMFKKAKARSIAAAKTLLVDAEVVQMLTKLHMKEDPFKEIAGCSTQVGTEEILVAEEDDLFDFANYEDPIYDAGEDQEFPVDHNEGPAQEKKPSSKKSPPSKREMIKPGTSSATVSSSPTVPQEIEEEEEEEEEAAEAP